MLLSQFPLTFHQQDAPFHCIAYGYSHTDWDSLLDHLRDASWQDIVKLNASAGLLNFVSEFRLELMYIFLIRSITSSLTHLSDFQLLVLLP